MALTRKYLKSIGLTDEQIEGIIESNEETITALKGQIASLQTDANRLKDVQRELDGLKSGTDWKAKHDALKTEYDEYKGSVAAKENAARIESAFGRLLTEESIDPRRQAAIIRATDLSGAKLDEGGKLENEAKYRAEIQNTWSDFKISTETRPVATKTPPDGGKVTRTVDEIMAIKDTGERQKAIAENMELFR